MIFQIKRSYVQGDLVIQKLPLDVTESKLRESFKQLIRISGRLFITENKHLISLGWIQGLQHCGTIMISNNAQLYDARLPNLQPGCLVTLKNNPVICDFYVPYGSGDCQEQISVTQDFSINVDIS
jgi:hypothetical protein